MKKSVQIVQEISLCSSCPHFKEESYQLNISDWFCTNPSSRTPSGNIRVGNYARRLIQAKVQYAVIVDLNYPGIPDWCPFEEVQKKEVK